MSWLIAALALAVLAWKSWSLWQSRAERDWRWWLGLAVPVLALLVLLAELGAVRSGLELQKLVGALVKPLGLLWLALLGVAAVAAWRGCRKLAWALGGLWLAFTLVTNVWVGAAMMGSLERRAPAFDEAAAPRFDAVVALGGGTFRPEGGRAQLRDGGDRVFRAAQLWHAGKAERLVAIGSPVAGMERARDAAGETVELWTSIGVPRSAIEILDGPRTTSEEIARLAREAEKRGWKRIAVVTSAWHLPRALRLARAQNLDVVGVPCDTRSEYSPWSLVWVVPHERGAQWVAVAWWEWVARVAGK